VKVLVTGGAGFLGQHFVRHHRANGDTVIAVDNFSNPHTKTPEDFGVEHNDAAVWFGQHADWKFDIAYHFAAPVGGREKIEGDPFYNADSLRLDQAFFRWAIKNVDLAIYPSSSAVYPIVHQGKRGLPLREDMVEPSHMVWYQPDEMYGFTKFVGEYLAAKAQKYGLNTLCIRPFSGYGEGQSMEYPVPSILRRALHQHDPIVVWGSGKQSRDFIHVSDLVGGTVARTSAGVVGYQSLNLGSGVATSFNRIAELGAELIGYEPTITNDTSKPEGVTNRFADVHEMSRYYIPQVGLREGLRRVLEAIDAEDR
jgi:UDP-glucose 4-epimerase